MQNLNKKVWTWFGSIKVLLRKNIECESGIKRYNFVMQTFCWLCLFVVEDIFELMQTLHWLINMKNKELKNIKIFVQFI